MLNCKRNKKTDLIIQLERAAVYLSEFSGGYSGDYISAQDFLSDFKLELENLKNGDEGSIEIFWLWFTPTYHWDDFTGSDKESEKYGNTIFRILSEYKKVAANTC